ncbi:MAG: oxidoreductase, partial [Desulfuromonadales bacterium]|nr:oxidoreductase [Desulfuromonadales bacterium]
WKKLAGDWKIDSLAALTQECSLGDLDEKIDAMLKGESKGRTLVNLDL